MIEDVTGDVDGREVALGTPEGNACLRANVERGLAGIEDAVKRAFHAREWSPAWVLRRDACGILENPEGFDVQNRLRAVGLTFRTGYLFLEPRWASPYGFADDLDNLRAYLRPFVEHPTRRFLVTYWVHRPHVRTGTGPGMVAAAVAGTPVSCAIRWRKNGPYVGTAVPNPEEHGPEYVCDVPNRSFLNFHVHEYAENDATLPLDVPLGAVDTPDAGRITDVVVHLCRDEDPEAVTWVDADGHRNDRARLIDFVHATGVVRPEIIGLAYAARHGVREDA